MPSDRSSSGLLQAPETSIRAPQTACRATASRTDPRQRARPRALASCLRPPPHLLPRRRCATAPASADFCPWLAFARAARRLRRQLRSRLRRLPQPRLARGARLHPGRPGVNRKRLNITAHYPKPLRLPQQSCSRLGPLRALRVRVMVCYVLRPRPSNCVIRRCAGFQSALRVGWPTLNRGAALPRLTARSLAGCAGQSVGVCRPTTTDFWLWLSMSVYLAACRFARHCPRTRLDRVRLACFPDCPAGAFPPDGGHDRKGSAR